MSKTQGVLFEVENYANEKKQGCNKVEALLGEVFRLAGRLF